MKNIFLTFLFLFLVSSCSKEEKINLGEATCNVTDPLTELAWVKPVYERHEASNVYTAVGLYLYKNETFIAFENLADSGPSGSIFNCAGQTIVELGINYNEFYNLAKPIKLIAELNKR